jgi:hypothetical protein
MAEADLQTAPALGRQGEPCAGCGAALAADQRYCLNCGRRRGEPRVDFAALLAPADSAPASATAGPAEQQPADEPARRGPDYSPLAAVGGIALLGLMLLVGVLIGRGDGDGGSAPAPQIIRVGQPAAGAVASTAGDDESGSKQAKRGGGKSTGAKKVDGGLTGSAASKSKDTVQASTDDLNELENQTGEAYQDAIEKLPDKIATPGKAPPIDKGTAPGGGGAAETIE